MSLPRGRHGLSREFVSGHQRERLLAAIATVLDRNGFERTTVSAIAAEAGVSKSDFYAHFDCKDECFATAYEVAARRLRVDAHAACDAHEAWAEAVCAGLAAALSALAAEPAKANLLLVEGLRAGPSVYAGFCGAVQSFAAELRSGAPPADGGAPRPPTTDEAVVGGVAALLGRRVTAGSAERLDRFFPEVAEFALAPYVGVAEARRIISTR